MKPMGKNRYGRNCDQRVIEGIPARTRWRSWSPLIASCMLVILSWTDTVASGIRLDSPQIGTEKQWLSEVEEALSESVRIRGRVVLRHSGIPVKNAFVEITGTLLRTRTDSSGYFQIKAPDSYADSSFYVLVYSHGMHFKKANTHEVVTIELSWQMPETYETGNLETETTIDLVPKLQYRQETVIVGHSLLKTYRKDDSPSLLFAPRRYFQHQKEIRLNPIENEFDGN